MGTVQSSDPECVTDSESSFDIIQSDSTGDNGVDQNFPLPKIDSNDSSWEEIESDLSYQKSRTKLPTLKQGFQSGYQILSSEYDSANLEFQTEPSLSRLRGYSPEQTQPPDLYSNQLQHESSNQLQDDSPQLTSQTEFSSSNQLPDDSSQLTSPTEFNSSNQLQDYSSQLTSPTEFNSSYQFQDDSQQLTSPSEFNSLNQLQDYSPQLTSPTEFNSSNQLQDYSSQQTSPSEFNPLNQLQVDSPQLTPPTAFSSSNQLQDDLSQRTSPTEFNSSNQLQDNSSHLTSLTAFNSSNQLQDDSTQLTSPTEFNSSNQLHDYSCQQTSPSEFYPLNQLQDDSIQLTPPTVFSSSNQLQDDLSQLTSLTEFNSSNRLQDNSIQLTSLTVFNSSNQLQYDSPQMTSPTEFNSSNQLQDYYSQQTSPSELDPSNQLQDDSPQLTPPTVFNSSNQLQDDSFQLISPTEFNSSNQLQDDLSQLTSLTEFNSSNQLQDDSPQLTSPSEFNSLNQLQDYSPKLTSPAEFNSLNQLQDYSFQQTPPSEFNPSNQLQDDSPQLTSPTAFNSSNQLQDYSSKLISLQEFNSSPPPIAPELDSPSQGIPFRHNPAKLEAFTHKIKNDNKIELHHAVTNNDLERVNLLLSYPDVHVNCMNVNNETPLHVAIKLNAKDIIDTLLDHTESNVNVQNKQKQTALHVLFQKAQKLLKNVEYRCDLLKKFLAKGIDVNHQDNLGKTALFYIRRDHDLLKFFLEKDIFDVCVQDKFKKTILHYYCIQPYAKLEIVQKMIESSEKKILNLTDENDQMPYECAEFKNKEKTMVDLLKPKEVSLMEIITGKDSRNLESFLETTSGLEEYCCQKTNKCALHFVLNRECDISEKCKFVQLILSKAKQLINHCDNNGQTPLHMAVSTNQPLEVIKLLVATDDELKEKCSHNINQTCRRCKTPLHYAIENGRCDVISLFFGNKNMSLSKNDGDNKNYLHYLCLHAPKMTQFCKKALLLQHSELDDTDAPKKAEYKTLSEMVNKKDKKECIPLFYVIQKDCPVNFLEFLLKEYHKAKDIVSIPCGDDQMSVLMKALSDDDCDAFIGILECFIRYLNDNSNELEAKDFITDRKHRNIFHYAFDVRSFSENYKSNLKRLMNFFDRGTLKELLYPSQKEEGALCPLEILRNSCKHEDDTDIIFEVADILNIAKHTVEDLRNMFFRIDNFKKSINDEESIHVLCDWFEENDERFNDIEIKEILHPDFFSNGGKLLEKMLTYDPSLTVDLLKRDIFLLSTKHCRNDLLDFLQEYSDDYEIKQMKGKKLKELRYFLGKNNGDNVQPIFILEKFLERCCPNCPNSEKEMIYSDIKSSTRHLPDLIEALLFRCPDFTLQDFYKILLKHHLGKCAHLLFNIIFDLND